MVCEVVDGPDVSSTFLTVVRDFCSFQDSAVDKLVDAILVGEG